MTYLKHTNHMFQTSKLGETAMTKLQQLINLIDGLDDKGPDYLQVREAKKLATDLRTEAGK